MKYYEKLVFNTHGDLPTAQGISRSGTFQGYYGIQYNHSGTLLFSRGGEPPVTVEGAYAFFTYPGPTFLYGAPLRRDTFRHTGVVARKYVIQSRKTGRPQRDRPVFFCGREQK